MATAEQSLGEEGGNSPPSDVTSTLPSASTPHQQSYSVFLAPDNLCGQTLLELVGGGHSILADIRILSERVPSAFLAAASLDTRGGGGFGNHDDGKKKKEASDNDKQQGLFLNMFQSSGAAGESSKSKDNNNAHDGSNSSSSKNDVEEAKKYSPFLFDFSYLHNPEEHEASLALPATSLSGEDANNEEGSENLLELEREFAVNHRHSIENFYELFFSIYNYQKELNRFVEDLTKGFYIQYTVESVLLDLDGRALLCEAVWLYGVMLILMERMLPVSSILSHGMNIYPH